MLAYRSEVAFVSMIERPRFKSRFRVTYSSPGEVIGKSFVRELDAHAYYIEMIKKADIADQLNRARCGVRREVAPAPAVETVDQFLSRGGRIQVCAPSMRGRRKREVTR